MFQKFGVEADEIEKLWLALHYAKDCGNVSVSLHKTFSSQKEFQTFLKQTFDFSGSKFPKVFGPTCLILL